MQVYVELFSEVRFVQFSHFFKVHFSSNIGLFLLDYLCFMCVLFIIFFKYWIISSGLLVFYVCSVHYYVGLSWLVLLRFPRCLK